MFRIQKVTQKASPTPIFDKDLTAIKRQVALWNETFGPGKVALWLFDTAFYQVYQAKGYEFTNDLLTQSRKGLRRSEGARNLEWIRRCKKVEAQSKAKEPKQNQVEAA